MQWKALAVVLMAIGGVCAAQEEVRIGSVSPVSGPSAHLGKDTENGARLAVEDLNAAGFSINGKRVKLVLFVEDDGGDPKQATAVAQKLVDAKVVGVIGHLNSGTSIPASKIYHDAGIPQISPAATSPYYTKQGFKSAFRVVANDNKVGATLGKYAVNVLKVQRVAIVDDRTAFGQGLADEFTKGVKAAGGTVDIVSKQFTNDRATDFTAILTQMKSKNPDLVFFGGMDAVGGPMLKQMRSLGMNVKFMGGDGLCSEKLGRLAADGIGEGMVTCAVAGGVSGAQEKVMADFIERYKKKFGLDLQTYAPYAYDATMLLAAAMQKAKSADPVKFLPELAKIKYTGVTGTISFDDNGDLTDGAMTIYTYRKAKKTKLDVVR